MISISHFLWRRTSCAILLRHFLFRWSFEHDVLNIESYYIKRMQWSAWIHFISLCLWFMRRDRYLMRDFWHKGFAEPQRNGLLSMPFLWLPRDIMPLQNFTPYRTQFYYAFSLAAEDKMLVSFRLKLWPVAYPRAAILIILSKRCSRLAFHADFLDGRDFESARAFYEDTFTRHELPFRAQFLDAAEIPAAFKLFLVSALYN